MSRQQDERGAISVLLAGLCAGLVALALAGVNAAGLAGVRAELRRAADQAALTGAATIPLIGVLAGDEPERNACRQAANALAPRSAPLVAELGATTPSCDSGITTERQADGYEIDAVSEALGRLVASATLPPELCLLPAPGLVDPFLSDLTGEECRSLTGAIDGLPENLAPAVSTPRLRVNVAGRFAGFVPFPGVDRGGDFSLDATARRRFKNLVVLPSVAGAPQPLADLNPTADLVGEALLDSVDATYRALAAALAPHLPTGTEFDLSGLLTDLRDLYAPPSSAPAPSPLDVAAEAAAHGDPVILLRLFQMPVLGIPALDFTAAYLEHVGGDVFRATPIPLAELTAASGIFAATLLRSGS